MLAVKSAATKWAPSATFVHVPLTSRCSVPSAGSAVIVSVSAVLSTSATAKLLHCSISAVSSVPDTLLSTAVGASLTAVMVTCAVATVLVVPSLTRQVKVSLPL